MSMLSTNPSLSYAVSASSSSPTRRNVLKRPLSTAIRNSNAEGPLRRPLTPLREPKPLINPVPPASPSSPPSLSPTPSPPNPVSVSTTILDPVKSTAVTIEFQRQMAKELQEYFKKKKAEEANEGPFFGFLPKNEISNGRWAMFGFAVGLLTEYATGTDFVDQLKILLSNFGIVDLE